MSSGLAHLVPLPACWRKEWRRHACSHRLIEFPTRTWLEAHPKEARQFTAWLWRQLATHKGEVCDRLGSETCRQCQRTSVSEVIAVRILGLLVRNIDPTLHFYLDQKFQRLVAPSPVRRPIRWPRPDPPPRGAPEPPPNGAPDLLGPLAVRMPLPRRWIRTNAVARELRKYRYWLSGP